MIIHMSGIQERETLPFAVYMMSGIGEARERLSKIPATTTTAVISLRGVTDKFMNRVK